MNRIISHVGSRCLVGRNGAGWRAAWATSAAASRQRPPRAGEPRAAHICGLRMGPAAPIAVARAQAGQHASRAACMATKAGVAAAQQRPSPGAKTAARRRKRRSRVVRGASKSPPPAGDGPSLWGGSAGRGWQAAAAAAAAPEQRARPRGGPSEGAEQGAERGDLDTWETASLQRYRWPLSRLPEPLPLTREEVALAQTQVCGPARALGDEWTELRDGLEHVRAGKGRNEVAIVGRSNAGKSTLINALVGGGGAQARTSKQPGCTTHLDFYQLTGGDGNGVVLVDMPGYGFAKTSKAQRDAWVQLIGGYLQRRSPNVLRCSIVLVDARRGITEADDEVMDMMDMQGLPYTVVVTKMDTLRPAELEHTMRGVQLSMLGRTAHFPVACTVSGHTKQGLRALKVTIAQAARLVTAQHHHA